MEVSGQLHAPAVERSVPQPGIELRYSSP